MDFDLNLLKVFDALMSEGSATRAAAKLGVSQAAVSASLSKLRRVYEDSLFTRTPRGLAPTPRALEIAPLLQDAIDSIAGSFGNVLDGEVDRYLRIGLSDDIEVAFGRRILDTILTVFPRARPVLRQIHSGISAEMLRDRSVDIAVGSGGMTGPGLQRQSVGESGYLTMSFSPPANGRAFTVEEFCFRSHLLISSSGLVGAVDTALLEMGLRRRVAASTSHFAATAFLLTGTSWISTIPSHAAVALAQKSELFISECPIPLRTYPIEVGSTVANLRDVFIARSLDALASSLRQAMAEAST